MLKSFNEILKTLMDKVRGTKLSDFNIGSVNRTILEAIAAGLEEIWFKLWLVLNKFFISTAAGEWLDKRVNDFGMKRKTGSKAFGILLCGRSTPMPIGVLIPVGTQFEDGSGIGFVSTQESSLLAGSKEIEVKVEALEVGNQSNLPVGKRLKQVGIAISGIEYVEVKEMTGGVSTETDEDLRNRVPEYFKSLGRAVKGAIEYAVMSVPRVNGVTIIENKPSKGWFTIYLDSNTDNATIAAVRAKVDEYRGFTIQYVVEASKKVIVDVKLALIIHVDYDAVYVKLAVKNAITNYINNLKMGEPLIIATLIQLAMNEQGVKNVKVNMPLIDIKPAENEILRPGEIDVV